VHEDKVSLLNSKVRKLRFSLSECVIEAETSFNLSRDPVILSGSAALLQSFADSFSVLVIERGINSRVAQFESFSNSVMGDGVVVKPRSQVS